MTIKTVISEPVAEEKKELVFPVLRKWIGPGHNPGQDNELIVLFTSSGAGVALSSKDLNRVGKTEIAWVPCSDPAWVPCSITLTSADE